MHEIKFKVKLKDEEFQSLKGKIPNKLFDKIYSLHYKHLKFL